jgi:hypothetical protein
MLFATGDDATGNPLRWMVMDKTETQTNTAGGNLDIVASHADADGGPVKMYNRAANPEDPWLSWQDHANSNPHCILYGENDITHLPFTQSIANGGLNVFVRRRGGSPETGWCGPEEAVIATGAYPDCVGECTEDPSCSYVRWVDDSSKHCNLMRECTTFNTDERWRHQQVLPRDLALTICPAGTFKEDESAAACESCPSLSYSPAGSTSPADCKCNAGLT